MPMARPPHFDSTVFSVSTRSACGAGSLTTKAPIDSRTRSCSSGSSFGGARDTLATLAEGSELLGAEVTGAHHGYVGEIFAALRPLLR